MNWVLHLNAQNGERKLIRFRTKNPKVWPNVGIITGWIWTVYRLDGHVDMMTIVVSLLCEYFYYIDFLKIKQTYLKIKEESQYIVIMEDGQSIS